MFFGLKNAGTTYQQLANKIFQVAHQKEYQSVYSDRLVKSTKDIEYIQDMQETFDVHR